MPLRSSAAHVVVVGHRARPPHEYSINADADIQQVSRFYL